MTVRSFACVVLVLAATTAAQAAISTEILRIEATNSLGTAELVVPATALSPITGVSGGWTWTQSGAVDLVEQFNPANIVATLNSATVTVVDDPFNVPRVMVNFEVRAMDFDVTFVVKSAQVSFPAMLAAETMGRSTAGYTLTDYDDGVDAVMESMDPPNLLGMMSSYYNGDDASGTQHADLITGLAVDNGGTVTASGAEPTVGVWDPLGESVSSIYVHSEFTLTALDLGSGNTAMFVMPEPGTFIAFGLAAFGLLRRR